MTQNIDPRTKRGFALLEEAFGPHKAWAARIAALETDISGQASWNRWVLDPRHTLQKQLAAAQFELHWLELNQGERE